MNKETKLQVEAIKNGTVIDHIPAQVGIKVLKLFDMHNSSQRVTIGLNLPSSALGNKDLLKIENVFINEEQASKLALYAPHATVNQIEDYQVVKKLALELPELSVMCLNAQTPTALRTMSQLRVTFACLRKKATYV